MKTADLTTEHLPLATEQDASLKSETKFRRAGAVSLGLALLFFVAIPLVLYTGSSVGIDSPAVSSVRGSLFEDRRLIGGKDAVDSRDEVLEEEEDEPTTSPSPAPSMASSSSPTVDPSPAPSPVPSPGPTQMPSLPQFYETVPKMSNSDIVEVMDWIKSEATSAKTDFCWKDSYGRGVGLIPQECPGRDRIGALCYSKCPAGYTRFGVDCHQTCPSRFRDDGLFCRKAEYGRGAGYPAWDMGKCESRHGRGNCEWWGALIYPKCKSGYHNVACCICRPNSFSCSSYGLGGQFDISCAKKIIIGDPIPMSCNSNQQMDAGLCYSPCNQGFYGVGPVCWSGCGQSTTDCGAACAESSLECFSSIFDQVISVVILAANIATLGLATPATAGASMTIRVAGKTVAGTTKLGKAMVKAVKYMQTIKPGLVDESVDITRRLVDPKTGAFIENVKRTIEVSAVGFEALQDYLDSYVEDFAGQTSPYINGVIDTKFNPTTARFIKESWATVQLEEMKEVENWDIAGAVLDAVAIIDITGVTGVVAAYANPICNVVSPFPCVDGVVSACP